MANENKSRLNDIPLGTVEDPARSGTLPGFQVIGSAHESYATKLDKTDKPQRAERDSVCGGVAQRRKEEAAEMQERLRLS